MPEPEFHSPTGMSVRLAGSMWNVAVLPGARGHRLFTANSDLLATDPRDVVDRVAEEAAGDDAASQLVGVLCVGSSSVSATASGRAANSTGVTLVTPQAAANCCAVSPSAEFISQRPNGGAPSGRPPP